MQRVIDNNMVKSVGFIPEREYDIIKTRQTACIDWALVIIR